jgi:hypothetical protein
LGVLERRLQRVQTVTPKAEEPLRSLLDRMTAMANGRFPAVSDLARELRYRCFDRLSFENARKQVYDQMEDHLAYLAANPVAADRHERVRALVDCPQPLVGMLSGRFETASPALRSLMLEALTCRYYRIRDLTSFRTLDVDGRCHALAEYDYEGKHTHLFATHTEYSRLSEAARTMFPMIADVPADHEVVLDFYVSYAGPLGDQEATSRKFTRL